MLRCYDCGGFNHVSKNCHEKIECLKCGEDHATNVCTKEDECCINCIKENRVNPAAQLDINHSRFDFTCSVYKKQINLAKQNICYLIRYSNQSQTIVTNKYLFFSGMHNVCATK
mgnify:CR=1 FL=1